MKKKVLLMILDGWGIATDPKVSAIDQANTPFIDSLYTKYPHATLSTSGLDVGLPNGQMGNSEVGHMNIGAGRVVYQMLVRINKSIEDGEIDQNPALLDALQYAKTNNKKVHLLGLVSDGGVHSHINHLKGLLKITQAHGLKDVFVHVFTDGRDTDPHNGVKYLNDLQSFLETNDAKVASVIGRYYAMDRDKRWERVKLAYDLLVHGTGEHATDPVKALEQSYAAGITDEFVKPIAITDNTGKPLATINEGDVVLFFNFRTDRGRELTMALTQQAFHEQNMAPLPLRYLTMTTYDESYKNVEVLFETDNLHHTLGEVLAQHHKTQIRIAETEKYPHVTFFFNGGREEPFIGEERIMCPSPKVATYDLKPEMSAYDLRDALVPKLLEGKADFVCLNFANADMVGHTGIFEAAVKACEVVDVCAHDVVEAALKGGYTTIIIADHGNSDCMINPDGTPNTAHTTNLVPFILVDDAYNQPIAGGRLGDLAPTILELMGIDKPKEMTGTSLLHPLSLQHMPRRWVISDIHGCNRTFKLLLERLALQPDDQLFLLGDYINKGPRSRKVINTILKLREEGFKVRCLMGNHEDLLLKCLEDPLLVPVFNQQGGKETLKSFKVKTVSDIPTEYINFFHSLEYYIELEDFVLVHAGLNFIDKNPFTDRHAMLWSRNNRIIPAKIQFRRIIHGHTPTKLNTIRAALKRLKNYTISIDAGCVYEAEGMGNLIALNLDTFELVVQKNEEGMQLPK